MDVNKKNNDQKTDNKQKQELELELELEQEQGQAIINECEKQENNQTLNENKLNEDEKETVSADEAGGEGKNQKGNFFSNIFSGKKDSSAEKSPSANDDSKDPSQKAADPKVELAEELAKAQEALLRSRADFDNYRKRIAREYQDVRNQAKINVISDFLPVYDYFQLAVTHAEQNADLNALKQGMQMILTEFKRAFDNLGAEEVNAAGQEFDARWHEAVAQENNAEIPEGQVLQQWKCGFRMGDTLIRPATVVVSAGPEKPNKEENSN
jgi:molecular chaperone GrpE